MKLKKMAWLYNLSSIKGLGPVRIRDLLKAFKDPQKIFYEDPRKLATIKWMKRYFIEKIKEQKNRFEEAQNFIEKQIEAAKNYNAKIVTFLDEEYPKVLRESSFCHPIIFVRGKFSILKRLGENSISIVGTRGASEYGKKMAYEFGKSFADKGWVVVSGLAKGIDCEAHRGCLDAWGTTVAVLGYGVDRLYPKSAKEIRNRILSRGLILSEYPLGTRPSPLTLKKRNKTMVGLSTRVLVIETGVKGGTFNAVNAAKEQKKPLFVLKPPPFKAPSFEGNAKLLSEKRGSAVKSAADVYKMIE